MGLHFISARYADGPRIASLQDRYLPGSPDIVVHKGVQQRGSTDELGGGNDKGAVDLRPAANEAQRSDLCKGDAAQEHDEHQLALLWRCTCMQMSGCLDMLGIEAEHDTW